MKPKESKPQKSKRKRIAPNKKTRHHMMPLCRISLDEIVDRPQFSRANIKYVQWRLHQAWHEVFDTLSPYEAVLLVIRDLSPPGYFTKAEIRVAWQKYSHDFELIGETDVTLPPRRKSANRDQAMRLLFGKRDWVDIVAQIVYVWSPVGYFKHVQVVGQSESGRNTFVCDESPIAAPEVSNESQTAAPNE